MPEASDLDNLLRGLVDRQLAVETRLQELGLLETPIGVAAHDLVSATHTASGLTIGQPLRATSATAFAFGALNLAGTSVVTGLLPPANGGTGLNAGSGLTTGQPLRATGAGTMAFGALDLAGVSVVTGLLPTANGGTGLNAGSGLTTGQALRATGAGTMAFGAIDLSNASAITAAGLTTGQALRATAATTMAWGAIDLTNANAVTGALPVNRGGLALSAAPTNGQLPIGNGIGYALAAITGTANRVTVTNGAGTIALNGPQDLDSAAAVTHGSINLGSSTGATAGELKASGDVFALGKLKGLQAQLQGFAIKNPTANQNLTTTLADFAGLTVTFTPAVAEIFLVNVCFDLNLNVGTAACVAQDVIECRLLLDGVVQNFGSQGAIFYDAPGANGRGFTSAWSTFNLSAAAHTIKVQVRNASGARGRADITSQMMYWRIAQ